MDDCIFCKIARKELPAEFVYEDDDVMVFYDIKPRAKTHVMVVPKKHIAIHDEVQDSDQELLGKILLTARDVARKLGIAEKGYRITHAVGKGGGQEVFHIHYHVLAD